jgi:hypothetical protein
VLVVESFHHAKQGKDVDVEMVVRAGCDVVSLDTAASAK